MAGALAYGYANIFVTAPSPENLKTVFEFLLKGARASEYKLNADPSTPLLSLLPLSLSLFIVGDVQ